MRSVKCLIKELFHWQVRAEWKTFPDYAFGRFDPYSNKEFSDIFFYKMWITVQGNSTLHEEHYINGS